MFIGFVAQNYMLVMSLGFKRRDKGMDISMEVRYNSDIYLLL